MHVLLDKIKQSPDIASQLEHAIHRENMSKETEVITFVNPYSYLLLRDKHELTKHIDAIHTDAISSAKLFSLFLGRTVPRNSFDMSSFAKTFLEKADEHKLKVYFIGAKAEEIEKTIAIFRNNYPNMNIVGYEHGYFDSEEDVFSRIATSGAEYVICGLGTPKQDEFAVKLKAKQGCVKQVYTCGGFLHQTSSKLHYYPAWIDKFHLRWLYRVFDSSYVLKRLLKQYPQFFGVFFVDLFKKTSE
ncbi:WecB/TagA/CpsF family glycosyltransferase [Pseudoalteromonas sp. S16_S37]|uniref:WecB/TagA/CpsF family glycosyltransferase n=1 Tax=Pseudoalteromonas sp. S16_S37 TaxID=2720228 RepID=UPI0016804385|nr:WecB/TagA/CpsF family glycosyltransferase [Pseudoalteromonas sp. S16_S37]MBD1580963.1 WecB/TagA/CpsF family glycosyltransferase [Pseudoalteromonas sp. S16_S37]